MLDVDTPDDLEAMREALERTRGGAAHTRGLLAEAGPQRAVDVISAVALPGLPEVAPGDDLGAMLAGAAPADLGDGDVLVVSQKVVSKAEGRVVRLRDVAPSPRAHELAATLGKDPRAVEVVLGETAAVVRAVRGVLIVPHAPRLRVRERGRRRLQRRAATTRSCCCPSTPTRPHGRCARRSGSCGASRRRS